MNSLNQLEIFKKIVVPTIESNRLETETGMGNMLDFGSCQYEDIAIEVSKYYKDILKNHNKYELIKIKSITT